MKQMAKKSRRPAQKLARRSTNKAKVWSFKFDDSGRLVAVLYPDGSSTHIEYDTISEVVGEYLSVQLGKPWPQVETGFNPPIVLKNPLASAFYDVLLRMSPAGHKGWKALPFFFQMETNHHLRACLHMIVALGYGEFLSANAEPVCKGAMAIPLLMARLDTQRFPIRTEVRGEGWFEQRWNLLKNQIGIE